MSDLSDFFAKKDLKNSKRIAKFTTINEIEQKLLKLDKKRELEKKHKDEEWNEFEEKLKDYSGLKIQNTVSESDEVDISESNIFDEKAAPSCPWKVIEKPENDSFMTETEVVKETAAKPVGDCNVYIPPHLRNKPTQRPWTETKVSKEQPKHANKALEINDKDVFPMLSATSGNMLVSKRKEKDTFS